MTTSNLNAADTATPSEPQSQTKPTTQLPPPHLFDILPALHETLARLDHTPTPTPDSLLQPQPPSPTTSAGHHYPDLQPLHPKDLPTAILPLKAQMRKGLREVEKLPDVARSVAEQEEEIAELEGRIRRQRSVLGGLGSMAGGLRTGGVGEGVGGG